MKIIKYGFIVICLLANSFSIATAGSLDYINDFYLVENKACENEIKHNDNLSFTTGAVHQEGFLSSDAVKLTFLRRRCIDNVNRAYFRYGVLVEATPISSGKSVIEIYDFKAIQGEKSTDFHIDAIMHDSLTTSKTYQVDTVSTSVAVYNNYENDIDYSSAFNLVIECKKSFANICPTSKKVLHFPAFGSQENTPQSVTLSNLSGVWYDPAYNGSGFNVVEAPNGLVMFFYGYKANASGQAQWLMSDVGPADIKQGQPMTLPLFTATVGNGGNFTTKPSNAPGISDWGTATVTFNSCNSATISLNGSDGKITHNVVKLANIKNLTCKD